MLPIPSSKKKKKENCLISAIDIYDIRLIPITVYSIVIAQNYSSLMAVRNWALIYFSVQYDIMTRKCRLLLKSLKHFFLN